MHKYAALLVSSLAWAQIPGPVRLPQPGIRPLALRDVRPEDRGLIEGRVVNAVTGEGIRKASVQLNWNGGGGVSLKTDAEGKFRAEQMAPGQYYSSVTAAGYVSQGFDGTNQVRLAPGGSNRAVLIKLAPHAVVSGRVLDEDGDPVPQTTVVVESRRRRAGQPNSAVHGSTDDRGEFRIAGLAAGKYVISANKQTPQMQQNAPSPSLMAIAQEIPVTTYFPSALDVATATVITLTPGAEHRSAEIRLRKSTSVTVSGRVDYPREEGAQTHISVQLNPVNRGGAGHYATAQADGRFQIANVTPGDYVLQAFVNASKPGSAPVNLTGRIRVQAANADLAGLVVTPWAPLNLSGVVKSEGAGLELNRLVVTFLPAAPEGGIPQGQGQVNKEGRFVALNVAPERYRLNVQGGTGEHYLKSALYGGKDVLKDGVELKSGTPGALEITMASDGGVIDGILEDAQMRPGTMAMVALWPRGDRREEIHRMMIRPAEAGGAYELEGVAPGDYKVAAFAVPPREASVLYSLDFLHKLDAVGESITVAANGKVTKPLKVRELPDEE